MLRTTKVENGRVTGIPAADPRITAYKGIPFAAPPVGSLRWRPPQPARDWNGEYRADRFAPIAMQSTPGLGDPEMLYNKEWHVDPEIEISEDCLYLNVWTPAKTGDEKFPVMVWIYGGGFQWGYASEMEFDGERIARRGVVLVSMTYRLNVFGFMAHPEVTKEGHAAPANFGLQDQLAALKWVRKNISAFGGDPDNVTLFGQSAGGGSVMAHLASPMSAGHFHKAIPQSCGGLSPTFMNHPPRLPEAEAQGQDFFKWAGIASLAEARAMDAKVLLEKGMAYPPPGGRRLAWGPVVDGGFLPDASADLIAANRRHPVPLMLGSAGAEFLFSPPAESAAALQAFARERFGENAAEYLELIGFDKLPLEQAAKNGTFNFFEEGNWLWARKNAELNAPPLYLYRFNPAIPGDDAGAFHSSELWFMFETLAKCWRPFTGKHYDLARQMCNYWTNFAKTGDPNGADADGSPMPAWEPYTAAEPFAMHFGDTPAMDKTPLSGLMRFMTENDYGRV